MAKRKKAHKRTNPDVPHKFTLSKMADKLWSLAVRKDCNDQCVVCRKRDVPLHAHHIIPRMYAVTRYDIWNGLALCFWDHTKNPAVAPHQNPEGWTQWLRKNMPARALWCSENCNPPIITKTEDYYCNAIRSLKEYVEENVYTEIVGIKFSAWLDEQEVDDV